ncbi:hypothetical protein VU01_100415 [Candidatus Electrothrix marina]|uniref:Uncharacterized protein n=1 Tax=Candidatus Electrothrix marina TaxID=1859130 RepID=A0A3S3U681_9BACT|nr:hypothetical protein VT99_14111 [Candidatus Electrothrix marina]RWX52510.1 hypothetical protein VU01_100415 [Candidatus Electrothrix marina]
MFFNNCSHRYNNIAYRRALSNKVKKIKELHQELAIILSADCTGHKNAVFCQFVTVCYGLTVFIGYGLRPRNWTAPYTIRSEMQNKTHLQTRGLFNDL